DAITKIFVGWHTATEEQGAALDGLLAIMQATGVHADVLEGGLASMGPIARAFGLSMAETAALIARFSQAGIDASTVTFGLRRLLKEAADAGVEPRKAFDDFIATMKGTSSEAEKLAEAEKVLGAR